MARFIHQFSIASLCGLLFIGQLPAWLHVANCDGHLHGKASHGAAEPHKDDGVASCCHHGHADHPPAEPESQEPPAHDGDHDSDRCPVCQSLAGPAGVPQFEDLNWCSATLVSRLGALAPPFAVDRSITLPQPRGPPLFVA